MEDEEYITFFDSDIEENFDVNVIEEIFDPNVVGYLTVSQQRDALTNLLADSYRSKTILASVVQSILSAIDPERPIPQIVSLSVKPIVEFDKILYNLDTEDIQDDYDLSQNFADEVYFKEFLDRFHALNISRTDTFANVSTLLFELFRSFDQHRRRERPRLYSVPRDVDAYRHCILGEENKCLNKSLVQKEYINTFYNNEILRILCTIESPFKYQTLIPESAHPKGVIYQVCEDKTKRERFVDNPPDIFGGDKVNIVGYFNRANANTEIFETFDIDEYFRYINDLKKHDKVVVCFNDFHVDNANDTTSLQGTVTRVSAERITINDTFVYYKNRSNGFYVYKPDRVYKFSKADLLTTNIAFLKYSDDDDNLSVTKSFSMPISTTEILFMHRVNLRYSTNMSDLQHVLDKYSYNADTIPNDKKFVLDRLFSSLYSLPRPIKKIRPMHQVHFLTDVDFLNFRKHVEFEFQEYYENFRDDLDVSRDILRYVFLLRQKDNGVSYFLRIIQRALRTKITKISLDETEKRLQSTIADLNKLTLVSGNMRECEQHFVVAKVYSSPERLNRDNKQDTIYFDEKLDTTDYAIKQKIDYAGKNNDEYYSLLINELLKKNIVSSNVDLEFEAASVLRGKRLVRTGDYCILNNENGSDTLYIRQKIADTNMWVKVTTSPVRILTNYCSKNILDFDKMIESNACVIDPFDSICKKRKHVVDNMKYGEMTNKTVVLRDMIDFINKHDDLDDNLKKRISFYASYLRISHVSESVLVKTIEEKIDYGQYTGELPDDGVKAQFTEGIQFGEQSNYAFATTIADPAVSTDENKIFLDILISFTGVNLTQGDIRIILEKIGVKYNADDKEKRLSESKEYRESKSKLAQGRNELLRRRRELTKEQISQVEKRYIDPWIKKIAEIENAIASNHTYDAFIYATVVLIVHIMAYYPRYLLNKFIPQCTQYLSYIGYPVEQENKDKSIFKYFACLLKSISQDGDSRFSLIQSKTIVQLDNILQNVAREYLRDNLGLEMMIGDNVTLIDSAKPETEKTKDLGKYYVLNESFKPNFTPTKTSKSKIVEYLLVMNAIIKKAPINKYDTFRNARLVNACCTEKFVSTVTYYTFFERNSDYKHRKRSIDSLPVTKNRHESFVAKSSVHVSENFFENKKIKVSNERVVPMKDNKFAEKIDNKQCFEQFIRKNKVFDTEIEREMLSKFDTKEYWERELPKFISLKFDTLRDRMRFLQNGSNFTTALTSLQDLLSGRINGAIIDTEKLQRRRSTLIMFLSSGLKTIMGKVINKFAVADNLKRTDIEKNPLLLLLKSINFNENFRDTIDNLRELLFESLEDIESLLFVSKDSTEEFDICFQNVVLLLYVLEKTFTSVLYAAIVKQVKFDEIDNISTNLDAVSRERYGLCSELVNVLMTTLFDLFASNDLDKDFINAENEKLREQRKTDQIAKYGSTDESRQTIRDLKKMINDPNFLPDFKDPDEEYLHDDEPFNAQQPDFRDDVPRDDTVHVGDTGGPDYYGEGADGENIDEDYDHGMDDEGDDYRSD